MPVDTSHPSYIATAPQWKVMRDVLDGEDAVKFAGEEYLPRLREQQPKDYESYKARGIFFNGTSRTHEALTGFVFRQDPMVKYPDDLQPFYQDCTMAGLPFMTYIEDVVREVMGVGRMGTLIDFDTLGERRPYIAKYKAEDIVNWRQDRVNGQMVMTLLVLHEISNEWIAGTDGPQPEDEFDLQDYDQWRVYRRQVDDDGSGYVTCEALRKLPVSQGQRKVAKTGDRLEDWGEQLQTDSCSRSSTRWVPTRRGQPLDEIPFVFHGPQNSLIDIDKIPLLDMARVNLSHYRSSVDLENGRHFIGLPTPYLFGQTAEEDDEIFLGATKILVSENAQAKCGFLEFSGTGLKSLTDALTEKEIDDGQQPGAAGSSNPRRKTPRPTTPCASGNPVNPRPS